MALRPEADLAKVELDTEGPFGNATKGAESGILVDIPEDLIYLGFHSFAWEKSFGNWATLDEYHQHYASLIGRRVFWTSMAERGSVLEQDGKKYAFIKLTDIIASDEPDGIATNVYRDENKGYSI